MDVELPKPISSDVVRKLSSEERPEEGSEVSEEEVDPVKEEKTREETGA